MERKRSAVTASEPTEVHWRKESRLRWYTCSQESGVWLRALEWRLSRAARSDTSIFLIDAVTSVSSRLGAGPVG